MTENNPTNRVLSGEVIIFQNEVLEIFKEVINNSSHPIHVPQIPKVKPVPYRYVVSIFVEFLRTLMEN